jgi:hypothetical protein
MRSLVLSAVAAGLFLAASPAFGYPAGAEALETRLLLKMGPEARAWIAAEAAHESSSRGVSGETARNAARGYSAIGPDADALAFLIVMQVARGADSAVSNVAASDMSANASKQDAREAQLRRDTTATSRREELSSGQQAALKNQGTAFVSLLPTDKNAGTSAAAVPVRASDGDQGVDLQDAMDRESKVEDVLADMMKSLPPVQEGLVQSLR